MALTIETDTADVIGLGDYLEHVRRHVDAGDSDSVLASAPQLKALVNNRTFLAEELARQLMDWRSFQRGNRSLAPTFTLARGAEWAVRANVWTPRADAAVMAQYQHEMLAYELAHDHSYSFLTAGYSGSGYETTIFDNLTPHLSGVAGERVDLRFLETTTLPPGKVMYYRAGRDLHWQTPPATISVSINLLTYPAADSLRDQHMFDVASSTVVRTMDFGIDGRCLLMRLAAHLGDARLVAPVEAVARTFPAARVRAEAIEALAALEPNHVEEAWRVGLADPDPFIRARSAEALAGSSTTPEPA